MEESAQYSSDALIDSLYVELHQLAQRRLAQLEPGQTLQPTALVHEAFLKLVGNEENSNWDSNGHFFGAAANAMRQILCDRARRKATGKHGKEWEKVSFHEALVGQPLDALETLALDDAIKKLECSNETLAQIVILRFYAGLSIEQTSQAIGLSPRSVTRKWTIAKSWLRRELTITKTDEKVDLV